MRKRRFDKLIRKIMGDQAEAISLTVDKTNLVILEGEVNDWQLADELAHKLAKKRGVRNVVNHLRLAGQPVKAPVSQAAIKRARDKGVIEEVDVVIIGAGVSGCGIARELSKYDLRIALVEKGNDVAVGASKANNGMIHPGNATQPFTLKAKMNVRGVELYPRWAKELNFHFEQIGSFVLAYEPADKKIMWLSYLAGRLNRVPGMKKMSGKEIMAMEPNLPKKPLAGVYTPTTAYVDSYNVVVALAENAATNGVRFYFGAEVLAIDVDEEHQVRQVISRRGVFNTRLVINAAGLHADEVAAMIDDQFYTIHPRRGTVLIFDKSIAVNGRALNGKTAIRKAHTKGGGLQRTVSGNPLWGPSAEEITDKEDTSVTAESFDYSFKLGKSVYNRIYPTDVIAYFSGIRPADYREDFIIEPSTKVNGFIHVAGIQSPGLASAPAIAERVEQLALKILKHPSLKPTYQPERPKPIIFSECNHQQQAELIEKDAAYGNIICRCETVTEAEIVQALHSPVPATTLDGLKKRTRARTGRCQGGFCEPKILAIMAREMNKKPTEIIKDGQGTYVIERRCRGEEVCQ